MGAAPQGVDTYTMRRYSPDNPGPVARSFARYIAEFVTPTYGIEVSPAQAQVFFTFHNEWHRWRNAPGGEAEQEKRSRWVVFFAWR
jgi:hypothetical protein